MKKTLTTLSLIAMAVSASAATETVTFDSIYTKDGVQGSLFENRADTALTGVTVGTFDPMTGNADMSKFLRFAVKVSDLYTTAESTSETYSLKSLSVVGVGGANKAWFCETARWTVKAFLGKDVNPADFKNTVGMTETAITLTNVVSEANNKQLNAEWVSGNGSLPAYTFTVADTDSLVFKADDYLVFYIYASETNSEIKMSDAVGTLGGLSYVSNNSYTTNWTSAPIVRITASAVPEPATATLSLLALAGLAARRRRK